MSSPILACLLAMLIGFPLMIWLHDKFFGKESSKNASKNSGEVANYQAKKATEIHKNQLKEIASIQNEKRTQVQLLKDYVSVWKEDLRIITWRNFNDEKTSEDFINNFLKKTENVSQKVNNFTPSSLMDISWKETTMSDINKAMNQIKKAHEIENNKK